ncbi:MAG: hypothetical protein KKF44_11415 [Nanoarchaeota archaeon]|nr:hypothetical protein [Nanoarchaeota archaeon]
MKKKLIVPPLSGTYMLSAMIGFMVSIIYIFPRWPPWGLAFSLTFLAMFLASMKSMTYADPEHFVTMEKKKGKKKK